VLGLCPGDFPFSSRHRKRASTSSCSPGAALLTARFHPGARRTRPCRDLPKSAGTTLLIRGSPGAAAILRRAGIPNSGRRQRDAPAHALARRGGNAGCAAAIASAASIAGRWR
jgi:hypothetical protein